MDCFSLFQLPTSAKPFDDELAFPNHTSYELLSKLDFEPTDFFDSLEDSLTKDTNTPKELTRFEDNTVTSIGLLEKKIQKIPKKNKKNTQDERPVTLAKARDKRNAKKPEHEYENTRIQEEQRKKTRKITKKIQKMRETLTKPGDIPTVTTEAEGPFRMNRVEESYQWRDWSLFFNQEMAGLAQDEAFAFFKIVHDQYPECISFDKGYGELKMVLPDSMKTKKLSPMVEQNLAFQLFCGCIEQVKKKRTENKAFI